MNKTENKPELFDKVEEILQNKKIKNKHEEVLKLEKKYPNNVHLKQIISKNFLAQGNNTKALDYLLEAKSIEPENYSVHFNLGVLYESFKKDEEAIECFKNSIDLKKDFINGYNSLAKIYLKKKKYKQTIIYLKKSVKIDKSIININAINSLALSIVANYFETKNLIELKDALIYFKKAHELDPSNDIFMQQLISFYHFVGLKNDAVYLSKKRTGFIEI